MTNIFFQNYQVLILGLRPSLNMRVTVSYIQSQDWVWKGPLDTRVPKFSRSSDFQASRRDFLKQDCLEHLAHLEALVIELMASLPKTVGTTSFLLLRSGAPMTSGSSFLAPSQHTHQEFGSSLGMASAFTFPTEDHPIEKTKQNYCEAPRTYSFELEAPRTYSLGWRLLKELYLATCLRGGRGEECRSQIVFQAKVQVDVFKMSRS